MATTQLRSPVMNTDGRVPGNVSSFDMLINTRTGNLTVLLWTGSWYRNTAEYIICDKIFSFVYFIYNTHEKVSTSTTTIVADSWMQIFLVGNTFSVVQTLYRATEKLHTFQNCIHVYTQQEVLGKQNHSCLMMNKSTILYMHLMVA